MLQTKCIFTVVSTNYLAQASIFFRTAKAAHPDHDIYIVLSDSHQAQLPGDIDDSHVIEAESVGIPHYDSMAIRYNATEFNTAIKPFIFGFLIEQMGYASICYVDPDTYFLSEMTELADVHNRGAEIVLTPHTLYPIEDNLHPNDFDFAKAGIYNLGFCSIVDSDEARRFIGWWCRKVETDCRIAIEEGIFVDQKWCDAVPALFARSHVLRHPGYNIGYWNLMHRAVSFDSSEGWKVGNLPIRFFHFSGLPMLDASMLSKHQNRIRTGALSHAVRQLLIHYKMALIESGYFRYSRLVHAPGPHAELGSSQLLTMVQEHFRSAPELAGIADDRKRLIKWIVCGCELASELLGRESLLPNGLVLIYRNREDLRSSFIPSEDAVEGFEAALAKWAAINIEREYPGEIAVMLRKMAEFLYLPGSRASAKADKHEDGPGNEPKVGFGRFDARFRHDIASQCIPEIEHTQSEPAFPGFLRVLLKSRPDILEGCSLSDTATRRKALEWARNHLVEEYGKPDVLEPFINALESHGLDWAQEIAAWPEVKSGGSKKLVCSKWGCEYGRKFALFSEGARTTADDLWRREKGALLVGYPRAQMGMGEHIRNTAAALEARGYPFSVFNFDSGLRCAQGDNELDGYLVDSARKSIQLLTVNADQTLLLSQIFGRDFFDQADYRIGFWAWELDTFPADWLPAIDLVDEIWVPSAFTASGIRKLTSKPVYAMPLTVEPGDVEPFDLNQYGVQPKAFKFLFTFDLSSFGARKNPWAVVEAFMSAFPASISKRQVSLVLKVIGVGNESELDRLSMVLDLDDRVFVVNETLPKARFNGLMCACDAYVSLHRSEGFGRGMAEAMYFGKPVIGTNYSGNLEFMSSVNSLLVDFTLRQVGDDEYTHASGAQWAEPDIDHAAELMRWVYENSHDVQEMALQGKSTIVTGFSAFAVGERYIERLQEIEQGVKIERTE